ncbi:UDP-glucose 4-epimerase GalE [Heyndrickxia coagulans]|uniref:UDP-glucose 4-epimerase n=1 Tax=Heyndrickxia coagulans DSM 1 = ATCC 7050 TaxID=1121088 RepID=A0A8B4BW79_HEYCO|nr:UDP-glucose 4-epimerase GalE [Heyndrickxia coagulans]AJH79467.1 UDP-glucose 4-epimerase GalE [Heyndrickxia coagulans DSM 1 = ATCC 7050]MCR2847148.1 UDP-glucose 4-epimerase GalE [Heyndrickxia coagulans]MDR4224881.1 UDP-glucose 4-epimerase GalE [Heyndrickxia coagulans DSM 1 = ATCC 7050]MED4493860.1 UDP-glucose 4-epimerase GalE [Heyndrickxia coagulans]MED4535869.1 UDP-glucose 4-epimerase GalE [Heyndrickxia coagulans]
MSILVLGGAGYIGSHAVYQLIDQKYDVVVIDNLQTGHRGAIHPKAKFYEGDIRDRAFMRDVFGKEKIDAIIHFAANSLVGESMEQPLKYFDNNVYGTQIVLEMMKEFHVPHIVFSSTAATYGEPDRVPITETMPTVPTNTYGETKLAMEKMMKWCEKAYGIKYVALRYFNVAGARSTGEIGEDHHPETHLIPVVLETVLGKREAITIFGEDYDTKDGTCVRDYIHVEDLIDAHILALQYLQNGGASDVFNLGSSNGFSVKEIVDTVREVTGKGFNVKIGDRRAGDPSTLIASSEKAKRVLGWNPKKTDIRQIIKDAWNWHESHPNGYDDRR